MNQKYWTDERIAGSLLFGSLIILLLAAVIMIVRGATPAFIAMLQGSLAQVVPYSATFRFLALLFILGWIINFLGLGLLAQLLARAGIEQLANLAFILILVATIIGILYSTFRMTVELWAAQEAAQTGSLPELYEVLREWMNISFRIATRIHFVAMAGLGWGILRTGLLAGWVGQVAIGWSLLLLIAGLGGGIPPAAPLIMPAVIGIALLLRGEKHSKAANL